MNIPANLKYTENDEWIRVEGNVGTVGITDHAQDQLSDIVFVEIVVSEGDSVQKGNTGATVESVKAAADVYLPASGTVLEVNDALPASPEVINSDPYGAAWFLQIEGGDASGLMDAAAYEKYCEERAH